MSHLGIFLVNKIFNIYIYIYVYILSQKKKKCIYLFCFLSKTRFLFLFWKGTPTTYMRNVATRFH